MSMVLRKVAVTRYITPLREGGSVPAIVEADDDGMYVVKLRGAGQGPRALVAEMLCGEIARALGLPMPEIVLADLDPDLARTEPDPELQDLIRASAGLNVALDYLPGAATFDPLAHPVDADLASAIVWFDAFVTNVDRTARNTNMLMWHRRLQLIDHGAALYFHHAWGDHRARSRDAFPMIREHVLLSQATRLQQAQERMMARLEPGRLAAIAAAIPDELLGGEGFVDAGAHRDAYADYLGLRLQNSHLFLQEAVRAHALRV